jgi:hypothetical protein
MAAKAEPAVHSKYWAFTTAWKTRRINSSAHIGSRFTTPLAVIVYISFGTAPVVNKIPMLTIVVPATTLLFTVSLAVHIDIAGRASLIVDIIPMPAIAVP